MLTEDKVYGNAQVVEGLRVAERSDELGGYAKRAIDMYEQMNGKQPNVMWRSALGHILENFNTFQQSLQETVTQASMPFLQDYGFELIIALMPGLIADRVFQTQPAKYKNYSVFYQNYQYGNTKGTTTANDNAITSLTADAINDDYTKDSEVDKTIGTGDGATAAYSVLAGVLYVPVVASSVAISSTDVGDNAMAVVDDGAGALTGDVAAPGTINYTTGALSFTFNANVKDGTAVLLTYEYVGEGSTTNAMQYNMVISEKTGQAKERRLRYNFSIESQFSYRQQFGRSMDGDLLAASIMEIRKEIDQDLILYGNTVAATTTGANASAGTVTWDRTPDTGVQYFFWREQFIDTLIEAGNLIVKATGLGQGNVAVGGITFKNVVETIGPRFKSANTSQVKGSRFIGTIDGNIDCFYEPAMADAKFFVTYKSDNPLEVGIAYNPWMPLYASDPHMLDNGKLHRYLITSSGKLLINPKLYVGGTITTS